MVLLRSSTGFCGFDSINSSGVFNWTGTDYTSRWLTKATQGQWITHNTDPGDSALDALAVWDLVDAYTPSTGVPALDGSYSYFTDNQNQFTADLGANRPVTYELDYGQNFTDAPLFACGHVFWRTPYRVLADPPIYDLPTAPPIPPNTEPGDSGSIVPALYTHGFPVIVHTAYGLVDDVSETVHSALSNAVSHTDNFDDAATLLGDLNWASDASGWAKVFPSWTPSASGWIRYLNDWHLGWMLYTGDRGNGLWFSLVNSGEVVPDMEVTATSVDLFEPWRTWFTGLGIHGWSGWAWDGIKFAMSKTQLRGVPGTSYASVKLQLNRINGARTIDAAEDLGDGTFSTSALELDLPTETPFPTAGTGGKIVEVWVVAIMGMTASDWADANGITLSV